jgi:HD-GYP domain-containing protein (c-di-GMP phosphodiesterase class II)
VEVEQLRATQLVGGRDVQSVLSAATARFVEAIGLPMYVRSRTGSFVALNGHFRRTFRYPTLEGINARRDVVIYDDDPETGDNGTTSDMTRLPVRAHLRTGDNRVRVVDEYAMTVGGERISVVVDVTEYVDEARRLQRAVASQTTLNDQLAGATAVLQKTQATAMKSLAKLAEYRDKETGGHLQRICEYMRLVTQDIRAHQPYSFSISSGYPDDIFLSGMLHDIGKVGVPDQILLKEGPLEPAEWNVMKQHTEWGHSILSQADQELGEQSFLTLASRIARNHHEWWDGTGYPDGLKGEAIPLSARIGAVADVYDALTSRRPYKKAWSHERAVDEIQHLSERQFDPVIVDIFTRRSEEFRAVRKRFPEEMPVLN